VLIAGLAILAVVLALGILIAYTFGHSNLQF
jgi:hypothetical protein